MSGFWQWWGRTVRPSTLRDSRWPTVAHLQRRRGSGGQDAAAAVQWSSVVSGCNKLACGLTLTKLTIVCDPRGKGYNQELLLLHLWCSSFLQAIAVRRQKIVGAVMFRATVAGELNWRLITGNSCCQHTSTEHHFIDEATLLLATVNCWQQLCMEAFSFYLVFTTSVYSDVFTSHPPSPCMYQVLAVLQLSHLSFSHKVMLVSPPRISLRAPFSSGASHNHGCSLPLFFFWESFEWSAISPLALRWGCRIPSMDQHACTGPQW